MKLVNLIAATLLALTGSAANASSTQSVTIFAKSDTRYDDGNLKMCSIQFSTIFADGVPIDRAYFAEGTIGFVFNDGRPGFAPFTKIAVGERMERDGKVTALPTPISSVLINGEGKISTNDFESATLENPENPASVLARYALTDKSKKWSFADLLVGKSIKLSFNLDANGKRYSIPVDLTLEGVGKDGKEKHSNKALLDFYACTSAMSRIARGQIVK
jgi:hypothetical protein